MVRMASFPQPASIIGIVGQPLAGKDSVAAILEGHGYTHVSTADMVRDYIREHNLGEPTRPLVRDTANALRAEHGGDYLVRLALQKYPEQVAISAIRAVNEAKCLQAEGGRLVWVEAPQKLRFARLRSRGRVGDDVTLEEFTAQEERETTNPDPNAQSVSSLRPLADLVIENTGDFESLRERVLAELLGV